MENSWLMMVPFGKSNGLIQILETFSLLAVMIKVSIFGKKGKAI
jgi:hypothetical protein